MLHVMLEIIVPCNIKVFLIPCLNVSVVFFFFFFLPGKIQLTETDKAASDFLPVMIGKEAAELENE